MPKLLLSLAFVLAFSMSFSQDYIITLKSDTLTGNVKLLSYDLLDRVQVTQDKKKSTYTALQVRRISIKGEQYAPVKLDNTIRFMKVLRSGFLSLYAHRGKGQGSYDTRVIQKIGENAIELPNIGFKKFIGEMVSNCTSVAEQVKSGDLDRNKVENLVDQYNVCVEASNQQRIEAALNAKSPVSELVDQMKSKVASSDLANKTDINELLNSIADRHKKKETVPVYMKEGLKGYIGSNDNLKADMEKLFTLLDQQ